MLGPFSQIEVAWRDTLIRKAEGAAFDQAATFHGAPRLSMFTRKAWRKGLHAVGWGPRGTPGTTFAFLEGVLSDLVASLTFKVKLLPVQPQLLGYVSGGPFGGFKVQHVNRFVRVESPTFGSAIYWTKGPSFLINPLESFLNLVPFKSAYWDAPDWTTLTAAQLDAGQNYLTATATILPFFVVEASPGPLLDVLGAEQGTAKGNACKYTLYLDNALVTVPGSYMQAVGAAQQVGMPYGGHIPANVLTPGGTPPSPVGPAATPPNAIPNSGPWPIYLGTGAIPGFVEVLDLLLAAGVQAEGKVVDWTKL